MTIHDRRCPKTRRRFLEAHVAHNWQGAHGKLYRCPGYQNWWAQIIATLKMDPKEGREECLGAQDATGHQPSSPGCGHSIDDIPVDLKG